MANKIFNTRVKNKRDTEANWKSKNPVLLDGEIIIVTTTSGDTRFKVGDGNKTYNQLPFQDQKTRDLIPSVDSSLSSTSTNPVQNKIIKSELDKKAERDVVNTTTNGLMSVADKKKLDGIDTGANKITVDTSLSSTSTNPVQNKIVNDALKEKFSTSGGDISGDVIMSKGLYLNGVLNAHETILAEKDVQCLYDDNSRIRLACDSSGAAKITTDGLHSYARLKIASPTDNDDATTKNYVDSGLSDKLDKSGGTLTGNLTGKYLTGTWLQTTAATDLGRAPGKIAVLDDSGWVYYRTPAEIKSDIGASVPVVTTSGSGNAYTATVPGVAEIKPGVMFVMIPHTDSTDIKPTLNVNNLGNYVIGRHASSPTNYRVYGNSSDWLHKGIPVLIMFGSIGWVVLDDTKPSADDLAGTVPISSGGTGATTAASARTNLGITNSDIVDLIYPVGSIYMSVNKTSPGTLFGGTWEQIAGKFLVGVGNGFVVGDSGGSKTHTHTTGDHALTTNEMPSHNHVLFYPNSGGQGVANIGYPDATINKTWWAEACKTGNEGGDAAHNHGNTGSASNLPPYLAVWIWKRTA